MPKLLKILLLISTFGFAASANAVIYPAFNAESDSFHSGGHNHALWLPGLIPGDANKDWLIDPASPGMFDLSGNSLTFTGSVFNESNPSATADFSFSFVKSSSGNPKEELMANAYSGNGGPVDTDTWKFYDFDPTMASTFTITADPDDVVEGTNYLFTQRVNSGDYKGQLGIGANGKNVDWGFSAWLNWWMLDPLGNPISSDFDLGGNCTDYDHCGKGDININVVPVPAAFWLFGTALIGFIGFSRRTSI